MSIQAQVQAALSRHDVTTAVRLLEAAADRGDAMAAFELGRWFLDGRMVRRDLPQSRFWFERAGQLGHDRARQIHIALMTNGVGGPRYWQDALAALGDLADDDPGARKQLELIRQMSLDDEGNPAPAPDVEPVARAPQIRWSRGLFSHAECALLIEIGAAFLAPSLVIDPQTGMARPDPIRTSRAAIFPWVDEGPFIHALNRRLAAVTETRVEQGEPLQVLEYAPGQEYRPHSDALSGVDNQRIMTALVYLNDDFDGGETSFPRLGLHLRGKRGDALIFDNVGKDGRADPAMIHAGRPVTRGVKYLASRWIRQADFGTR